MALSNTNIVHAKQILSKIVSYTNKLRDVNKIKSFVKNDLNMMMFFKDTPIGISLFSELDELISIINKFYGELDSLNNHTYNFLNRQMEEVEDLNVKRAKGDADLSFKNIASVSKLRNNKKILK